MFGLPLSVMIYLATEPVSMRLGPDGLAAIVQRTLGADVYSGHLFVFLSRSRERAKILFFDRGGFVVYYKRLERGRFRRPEVDSGGAVQLTAAELASLLEGIDLRQAPRARLWQPRSPPKMGIDTAAPM